MIFILLISAFICMSGMAALWHFAWKANRVDYIDVGWASGVVIASCLYAAFIFDGNFRAIIIAACPVLWATRLATHLFSRIKKTPEDPRYAKYREVWGTSAKYKFLALFVFQGFLSFVLSLAILAAMDGNSNVLHFLDYVGLFIFVVAFYFEALSDKQLRDWKHDPKTKDKLCRAGLWNYSRHPNYFFEWLKWSSYVVFAISGSLWWLSFIGVATMYYLLVYVTGIPPSEERSLKNRGDEFKQYQREVNAFFPGPRYI